MYTSQDTTTDDEQNIEEEKENQEPKEEFCEDISSLLDNFLSLLFVTSEDEAETETKLEKVGGNYHDDRFSFEVFLAL